MSEKLKAITKSIQNTLEEAKKAAAVAVREAFTEIFDKYPDLESFSIIGYTPYFNDGEPCEYGISVDSYSSRLNGMNDDEFMDEHNIPWEDNKQTREQKSIMKDREKKYSDIEKVVSALDSSVWQSMFDEGEIVVNRKGKIVVEEYNHD